MARPGDPNILFPESSGPVWSGPELCPDCAGRGLATRAGGPPTWCSTCHGAGLITHPGGA